MKTLRDVAEDLAAGRIGIEEAGGLARELTAGSVEVIAGMKHRVLRGSGEVASELEELSRTISSPTATDRQRWAGASLLVQAQLGAGNLGGALGLARKLLAAPLADPGAVSRFAVATIDRIIEALPPGEGEQAGWLIRERRRFLGKRPPAEPLDEDALPDGASSAAGLTSHQLGNSLVAKGDLLRAVAAYSRAIQVRRGLSPRLQTVEERNWLAGSYKMRATASMQMFLASGGERSLHESAQQDIARAVAMRGELRSSEPFSPDLAHDYAMTLWTRAWIEGSVWNQLLAMEDLAEAVKILRALIYEQGRATWLPDLAMSLADRVKFGVAAVGQGYEMDLLEEAEECLRTYTSLLRSGTVAVRAKFLEFLAHGASPAAYSQGRPDRAVGFLDVGLDEAESILSEPAPDSAALAGLGLYFQVPAGVLSDLAREHGFDLKRFERLKQAAAEAQGAVRARR
jgi:tetratricopeptide (TPR) repeat protein